MIMKGIVYLLLRRRLKRKPKVTNIVCPRCQRQADKGTAYAGMKPPASENARDRSRLMMAQQAMDAAADLDVRRRQWAGGDPHKNQLLSVIEAGFIQSVTDIGRKLRRLDEQDEQP